MTGMRYDQGNFNKGELDPKAHARIDYEDYYKSVKKMRNMLSIPQGGASTRFGTTYVDSLAIATNPKYCEITTLNYDYKTLYLLVWEASSLKIYLENLLVATVTSNTYLQEDIPNLRCTQVDTRIICANANVAPKQLVRSGASANVIASIDSSANTITLTTAVTGAMGLILPITFTVGMTLPTTKPQIYVGRTYFMKFSSTTVGQIFDTADDASNGVNAFVIINIGAGTNNVIVQNTWALSTILFQSKDNTTTQRYAPSYDFSTPAVGSYSAFGFTPSAISGTLGSLVVVTIDSALSTMIDSVFVGGVFTGNGGVLRITAVSSTTSFSGITLESFTNTTKIAGTLAYLGEPAWSATRGWPRTASFFQNRLVFGGSPSISNGVWLSVSNEVFNFDDSESLADNAISWYPSSGSQMDIRGLTSCRTLLVHTSTGNWSSPFGNEAAVTPTNFNLVQHNQDGVSDVQPVFTDNQVIYISGKNNTNVKSMVWEIAQQSFDLNNISVASSHLIVKPTDLAALSEPDFTDGSYVFLINSDGTLAVFQTLLLQNISAWSLSNTTQVVEVGGTPLTSNFVHVASALDRCWFMLQRTQYTASSGTTITAFSSVNHTLTATSHGMTIGLPTFVGFTTTGSLPVTSPQVAVNAYYWAVAVDANTFKIYATQADAVAGTSVFSITSAGTTSKVVPQVASQVLMIEELNFGVYTDSSVSYTNVNSNTLTGLARFNGNLLQIFADGVVIPAQQVQNGQLVLPVTVTNAVVGLGYQSLLSPLPVNNAMADGNNFYKAKHIRTLYLNYYQTVGAQLQGYDIPVQNVQDIILGEGAIPRDGIYTYTPMGAWDGFAYDIEITQSNPLPMTIRGIGYDLEI